MTTETILTDFQLIEICQKYGPLENMDLSRAIEQAVLQSPEVQALKRDKERMDWLADPKNSIGNVQLPIDCVKNNLHSLRGAIDEAMEQK